MFIIAICIMIVIDDETEVKKRGASLSSFSPQTLLQELEVRTRKQVTLKTLHCICLICQSVRTFMCCNHKSGMARTMLYVDLKNTHT